MTLQDYTDYLRKKTGEPVPDFDPDGPLETAEYLAVLLRPGPRGAAKTNVLSPTKNDDLTARNMRELFAKAGLDENKVLFSNICPYADPTGGNAKPTANEIRQGTAYLRRLVGLLPNLKGVILMGLEAQKAAKELRRIGDIKIVCTYHPGPRVKASIEKYNTIAPKLAELK
ncbi:uracil-DNA glycosylase family protein [Phaeobacter marinintestinus]|uniref:uracil-DNA glycosylase family protein n=1 Tax=Falsiphaeobacter marinintestinus TaxID=1492905 RepID=UPI0011B6CDA5|nr:uracil-DNA glycosylase family protein [Phaeobacter marinintestinus]